MINIAVVCEYNPLHLGHIKQFNFIRNYFMPEETRIICVMSGNYVQRGEPAVAHKYKRAEFALKNGADLVLELPFPYSIGMAQDFASSSIDIITRLGNIDYLCFGSENGDALTVRRAAENLLDPAFCAELSARTRCDYSVSYAQSREKLYNEMFGKELLTTPNDILALEYAKNLIIRKSKIQMIANPRTSDYSATASRKALVLKHSDELAAMLPKSVLTYFCDKKMISLSELDEYVSLFFALSDPKDFELIYEMNFDLASKICTQAKHSSNIIDLINAVSDKRYTRARVRRAMISALVGVNKEHLSTPPAYTLMLGSNTKGREYLSTVKSDIPVVTRRSEIVGNKKAIEQYDLSTKADILYNHVLDKNNIEIIKKPYICV